MSADGLLLPQIDILIMLTIAILTAIVVKKYIKLPYTITLVLVGMFMGMLKLTHIELTKEMIFFYFLPPLLFEGAIHFEFNKLRENFKVIGTLAFFGLIITTTLVGLSVHYLLGLPLLYALLFGAIISPTDPISVLALFKKLGVDKKLSLLVEGESIFNDATGIVIFGILVGLIETGSFNTGHTIANFIAVSVGGILVGVILGFLAYQIMRSIDDDVVEVLVTIIVAYAAFMIAEHTLHLSGVMAVVAAGVLIGNQGKKFAMTPSTRLAVGNFWHLCAFIINSLIFIMIGIVIPITSVIAHWYMVLVGIAAVLIARGISVYSLVGILQLTGTKIPKGWNHVMNLGGIHGSIPIALGLGLAHTMQWREEILIMVYGGVLFSLIVQGLLMAPLIRKLNIVTIDEKEERYESLVAERIAVSNMVGEIKKLAKKRSIAKEKAQMLTTQLQRRLKGVALKIKHVDSNKVIQLKRKKEVRRRLLMIEKDTYKHLMHSGALSEPNAYKLIERVDHELDAFD